MKELYGTRQGVQSAFRFCGPDFNRWRNAFDPKTRQFVGRRGMWALIRRKKLLSDVASKKLEVLKTNRGSLDQKVVVFSESVSAIENLKLFLDEQNIPTETFHAAKEPWTRQSILDRWGKDFNVLLCCRALDEGSDVKEVAAGVLITNGKSTRQFIQRIGRIIRPLEGKHARFYAVYASGTAEETYLKTILSILKSSVADPSLITTPAALSNEVTL